MTLTFSSDPVMYGFAGRQFDLESGLYYYRARMYDPQTARFLSMDPLGLAAGTNLYTYASNNPLSFSDPMGTYPEDHGVPPGADPVAYRSGMGIVAGPTLAILGGVAVAPAAALLSGTIMTHVATDLSVTATAINYCLANTACINQLVVSGGAGFMAGLVNTIDNFNSKNPGFLNSNGILVSPGTSASYGIGELLGTGVGKAINACTK